MSWETGDPWPYPLGWPLMAGAQVGWLCPKCGAVYAPWVAQCFANHLGDVTASSGTGGQPADPPGTDDKATP